jgi:hypothetical protein
VRGCCDTSSLTSDVHVIATDALETARERDAHAGETAVLREVMLTGGFLNLRIIDVVDEYDKSDITTYTS